MDGQILLTGRPIYATKSKPVKFLLSCNPPVIRPLFLRFVAIPVKIFDVACKCLIPLAKNHGDSLSARIWLHFSVKPPMKRLYNS